MSKVLKPDKLKQVELEIKNYDVQHFMYSIELLMWKSTDGTKFEENQAREIAEIKRTRYYKGYKQIHKGPYTLNIPSVDKRSPLKTKEDLNLEGEELLEYQKTRAKLTFQTTNDNLMSFFSDIKGKFLEKNREVSEKGGRPDVSLEFDHLKTLWLSDRNGTIKNKRIEYEEEFDVIRMEAKDVFNAVMLFDFD